MSMLDQNAYRKQSAIAEIAKAALQDADPLLDELARGEPALTPQRRCRSPADGVRGSRFGHQWTASRAPRV
jgi:hypothetical protein